MGFDPHFFPPEAPGGEYHLITWYTEIEEPIKSYDKHYSLVLYSIY